MQRTPIGSSFVMVAMLALSSVAAAQTSGPSPIPPRTTPFSRRLFETMYGTGAAAPTARIIFQHKEEDGQLCVTLGTKRGPRQIARNLFSFSRFTIVDGERNEAQLKLDFPKKAELEDKTLRVYRACLESEAHLDGAERDELEILVRRPRYRDALFRIDYPPSDIEWGIDILWLEDGSLMSQAYDPGTQG